MIKRNTMTEAVAKSSFQELKESVESLPLDDQQMLLNIINMRIIERRRDELVADMEESLEAYRKGEVRIGTVDDLLRDLDEDLRDLRLRNSPMPEPFEEPLKFCGSGGPSRTFCGPARSSTCARTLAHARWRLG